MGALALGIDDCLRRELNVDAVLALSPPSRRVAIEADEVGKAEGGFFGRRFSAARLNVVSQD